MRNGLFAYGLSVLASVTLSAPVARAGGTLDEAALAAELSRMGCHVETRVLGGSLAVERVETFKELSDDLFVRLKGLRHLASLDIRLLAEHSGTACLRGLASLYALRELTISGPELGDQAAQYIGCMTNLESLRLYSVSLSEVGLVRLADLRALKHLDLKDLEPITQRGLKTIASLTNLEEISIGGNCEKGALLALKPLKKLATIAVGGTDVDEQLAELRTLPSVSTVKIFRATITPATAESLLAIQNLETLELGCCNIEPEAAKRMQSLHLKRLDCQGADSKAYEQLLKALGPDLWELHASSQR
jgi:hypothetical protein